MSVKAGYFDAGDPLKISFPAERRDHLAAIEREHFWFSPRDTLLAEILNRIAPPARRIVELGCGTGRFISILQGPAELIMGVDAFENSIQAAASTGKEAVWLRGDLCAMPVADESFDVAVSMDVLEHVEPGPFLSEARRIVHNDGLLLLSVPAGRFLWSDADTAAGHRCRYTVKMLSGELTMNGWRMLGYTYYQFFLYPLMMLSRAVLKAKVRAERHPPVSLNRFFRAVNTAEVRLFSRACLPFGSSLVMWAKKA